MAHAYAARIIRDHAPPHVAITVDHQINLRKRPNPQLQRMYHMKMYFEKDFFRKWKITNVETKCNIDRRSHGFFLSTLSRSAPTRPRRTPIVLPKCANGDLL